MKGPLEEGNPGPHGNRGRGRKLHDEQLIGARGGLVGGGATHAWVQIYLPGAGWVEVDPTNGLVGGRI